MSKLLKQRVAVLIDGQNIYLSAKARGAKPDYGRILKVLNDRQVVRAIIYNIQPEGVDQSKFIFAVESMGYEVKSKRPRPLPDGTFKADWDMQIAIDALSLADKMDVIVILSGDVDFVPLVHALKSKGVKVEVMSFPENTAKELIDAADVYMPITDDMLIYE
ncbi:MAG: NYN domain-containing protein [Candidatus Aenigmatarchaeota archaeon]